MPSRHLGEVAGIFLQRVIAALGARGVGGAALAQFGDRLLERLRLRVALGQRVGGVGALGQRQRHQHALDGDEGIARLLGDGFGLVEDARRLGRHVDLARALAFDLGLLGKVGLNRAVNGAGIAACRRNEVGGEAFRIVEQDFQKVVGNEPLVTFAQSQHLGTLQETAHALGVLLLIHFSTLSFAPPSSAGERVDPLQRHPGADMGRDPDLARPDRT